MDWLLAIVALCLVIIIHESGHFIAAVANGMRVERFSIFGIGPVVARLGTWRGTEFVISAVPFGAYVMIQGMEPEDSGDSDEQGANPAGRDPDPALYRNKPIWARFLVLFGGPGANYLAATLILFGVYSMVGAEAIVISEFSEGSSALVAGLEEGDQLIQIGDATIDPGQGVGSVQDATGKYLGQTVDITVLRQDQRVTRSITLPAQAPALGVLLGQQASGRPVGLQEAALLALEKPWAITAAQLGGLYQLVTGQLEADMTGPVGIVKHIKRSAEAGLVPFMITAAMISTLLGMFNLLPLPALDGGRIVFLGFEAVARRPASGRVEGMVHGYGMLVLLLFLAIVTVGDIRGL